MNTTIFIPGNVPSSKNSKQWTGKFLVSSKNTQIWKKDTGIFWKKYKSDFLEQINNLPLDNSPLLLGLHFVRKSRHKFDFNNVTQTIQDEMVNYNWVEDDNCDIILPVPIFINNSSYTYNKLNPGVYIKILYRNKNNFVSLTI